jgi:hypothetical protein
MLRERLLFARRLLYTHARSSKTQRFRRERKTRDLLRGGVQTSRAKDV